MISSVHKESRYVPKYFTLHWGSIFPEVAMYLLLHKAYLRKKSVVKNKYLGIYVLCTYELLESWHISLVSHSVISNIRLSSIHFIV